MLTYRKVASVVNSVKNDNPDCIMELEEYKKKLHSRGLGRFFKTKDDDEYKKDLEAEIEKKTMKEPKHDTNDPRVNKKGENAVKEIQTSIDQFKIDSSQDSEPPNKENKELVKSNPRDGQISPKDKGIPLRLFPGRGDKKEQEVYEQPRSQET